MSGRKKHHHHHHHSKRAKDEMKRRLEGDTEHEMHYRLEEGPPEGDGIVPTPDETRTIKRVTEWSSSESLHLDESSSDPGGFSVSDSHSSVSSLSEGSKKSWKNKHASSSSSGSSSSSSSSSSSDSSSYGDDTHHHKEGFVAKTENDHDAISKNLGGGSNAMSNQDKMGDNAAESASEAEGEPQNTKSAGHRKRHRKMKKAHMKNEKKKVSKSKNTSSTGRHGRTGKHHRMGDGVHRDPNTGKFQSSSSSKNTKSDCHLHSKSKGQNKKREGGPLGQGEAKQPKSSANQRNTKSNNERPNIFENEKNDWETTTYRIQFIGSPSTLDEAANQDNENRIALNLKNEGVTFEKTSSENMKMRIMGKMSGSNQNRDAEDFQQTSSTSKRNKKVTNSSSKAGRDSTFDVPDTERDLVGKVTLIGGNNTFGHDVVFDMPNINVPGHHSPGSSVTQNGLKLVLGAGEQIHQKREIASANIDNKTTRYQERYPDYPTLEHLTDNTYEDKSLRSYKIKHTDSNPHPVMDYYNQKIRPRLTEENANNYVYRSEDNKDYYIMKSRMFEKTISDMKSNPTVASKINNVSDVSSMEVYVTPAEQKGDIKNMLKQKTSSSLNKPGQKDQYQNTTSTSRSVPRKFDFTSKTTAQPKSAAGRSNTSQDNEGLMGQSDFGNRSWISSAEKSGVDPSKVGSAYVILQIESIPARRLKEMQ